MSVNAIHTFVSKGRDGIKEKLGILNSEKPTSIKTFYNNSNLPDTGL